MNLKLKEATTITDKVERVQLILASVVGSICVVEWIATFKVVRSIFEPDYLKLLDAIRVGLASFGLIIASLIGIKAALWLAGRAFELREAYAKLIEDKKKKDDIG